MRLDKIFIFSGTSEGRELSEYLCSLGIHNHVFVATEYGKVVMKENQYATVHKGRLNADELTSLLKKERPDMVFDATHPYAKEVSKNIKDSLAELGVADKYIRVIRTLPILEGATAGDGGEGMINSAIASEKGWSELKIDVVSSTDNAIELLKDIDGNILLTTGVKSLREYASEPAIKDRLVARILPSIESLNIALSTGIEPKKIIAMEGPFSEEINISLIHQYDIKVMVTKNSGSRGGFEAKALACLASGIRLLVIDSGEREEGVSLEEAKRLFGAHTIKSVAIVGIGPGYEKGITIEAFECIKKAELIIGAERMVSFGEKINPGAKKLISYSPSVIEDAIRNSDFANIAYLVSGDSGFYSGANKVVENLGLGCEFGQEELTDTKYFIHIYPGISSISYFASKTGVPYSSMKLLSFHGKEIDYGVIENKESFYALTAGKDNVAEVVKKVFAADKRAIVYVGYNLGYEDEKIYKLSGDSSFNIDQEGLYVIGAIFNE